MNEKLQGFLANLSVMLMGESDGPGMFIAPDSPSMLVSIRMPKSAQNLIAHMYDKLPPDFNPDKLSLGEFETELCSLLLVNGISLTAITTMIAVVEGPKSVETLIRTLEALVVKTHAAYVEKTTKK